MSKPEKFRLRRTMMFASAQKPSLVKDAYIYKPDSLIIDLEDAVAENQKDSARFSLYHILQTVDFRGTERLVRINGHAPLAGRRSCLRSRRSRWYPYR